MRAATPTTLAAFVVPVTESGMGSGDGFAAAGARS